jgi:hypothetical protein
VRKFLKGRKSHGTYNYILSELRIKDRKGFKNVIRTTPTDFEELLIWYLRIFLGGTFLFDRLQLISWLLTGDSLVSLMYLFRIFWASISRVIPEVCNAMITALREYIKA